MKSQNLTSLLTRAALASVLVTLGTAAHATTPSGWLDYVPAGGNGSLSGWAADTAVPSTSITVHVYFDRGTPQQRVYAVPTNVSRPDVNAALGITGNHGYNFTIPADLLDGHQHSVDVFAIDPHGAGNPLLLGCPKYFYLAAPLSPSSVISNPTPTYIWQAGPNAQGYTIWVDPYPYHDDGSMLRKYYPASVCVGPTCSATPAGATLAIDHYVWYIVTNHPDEAETWSGPMWFSVAPAWNENTRCPGNSAAADFNGDGKTDKLCSLEGVTYVALSTGTGFQPATPWMDQTVPANMVADFNGDGKADLLKYEYNTSGARTFSVALSTGSGFSPFTAWGEATAGGEPCEWNSTQGIGNFDGNGLPDVWCHSNVGMTIFVGLNTGSSFTFSLWGNDACTAYPNARVGPHDFDGDGRDDWSCVNSYGNVEIRLSNGQAFEANSFQPLNPFCAQYDYTFVDLNGDGKTDVTCAPNGFTALSTGAAFLATASGGGWCQFYDTVPPGEEPTLRSRTQPMDIDGDHMPELLCVFAGSSGREVQVRRWTGTTLGPATVLVWDFCDPGSSGSSITGGDFDGDGKGELVCDYGSILTAGPRNVIPDLVIGARNELGGEVAVSYGPSSQFPSTNNPGVQQVVTSMTATDGRGGSATTSYSYSGAKVDRVENVNLGFGGVLAVSPCLAGESAPCPRVATVFSQELRSRGMPILTLRKDSPSFVRQATQWTFYPQTGPALPRKALVQEVRTTDYDASGGSKSTSITYSYDTYGNVSQQVSHGQVNADGSEIPGDERWTDFIYTPNTSLYLVSRLTHKQELDGTYTLLTAEDRSYNGADLASVTTLVKAPNRPNHWVARSMTYYADGEVHTLTDELGGTTTIGYDSATLLPNSVTNPAQETTTTGWHPLCSQPATVTDANNQTATTSYDPLCRPLRTDLPGGGYAIRSYADLGDPQNQRTRVETPGTSGNDYSEQSFDGLGRVYLTRKRGPSSGQDILIERAYDSRGNLSAESAPFYEGDSPDTTQYTYDRFNRVTAIIPPGGAGYQTTKSYGLWSETTTDANGRSTTVSADGIHKTETTDIDGTPVSTHYTYDVLGRLTTLQDHLGNSWSWMYDSLGRKVFSHDPDAGEWSWLYDDAARTQTQTDAKGQTATTQLNTSGRVVTRTSGVGTVTFTYSEPSTSYKNVGRLTTVTSPGTTLKLDYDGMGRLKRQSRTIAGTGDYVMNADYDLAGRPRSTTYPDGESIGPATYDEAGRLLSIPGILSSVTYDAAGRPLVQTNANGTVTTRTYWPQRGLLHTLVTTSPAQEGPVQNLNYQNYDPVGLLKSVTSPVAGESWSYDYDGAYRLTSAGSSNGDQTFQYDAIGRMTYNSRVGIYTYPSTGQPRPHAPATAGSNSYSYDANGNLSSGGGRSPLWDAENRITSIGTTQFAYDASGERIKKTSAQGTSFYPFGDDYEVTNGQTTKYISVPGLGVIAKRVGAPNMTPLTYWLHTDRLGSIQAITTADNNLPDQPAGTLIFRRTYRPYGETLSTTGSHTESRGWIDQRNDTETGLTYLHARYYDPMLGTFLSPDPIGVAGGMNAFGYGLGNPIGRADRSGLMADCGNYWLATLEHGQPSPGALPGGGISVGPSPEQVEEFLGDCTEFDGGPLDSAARQARFFDYYGGSVDPMRPQAQPRDCKPGQPGCPAQTPPATPPATPPPPGRQPPRGIRQTVCSDIIPNGRTVGAQYGVGGTGAALGGVEVVMNYDSGQVSAFAFGGGHGGWNGIFSSSITGGFAWGLDGSNSNYSGGFSGFEISVTPVGLYGASSHDGLSHGLRGAIPNGRVRTGGLSVGTSLLGGVTAGGEVTSYTSPLQLGSFAPLSSPLDLVIYSARQLLCN